MQRCKNVFGCNVEAPKYNKMFEEVYSMSANLLDSVIKKIT